MNVRDAMTANPRVVAPEESIGDAEAVMRRGRFRHLPVVAGGELVGVVSERDLHGAEGGDDAVRRGRPVRTVMTADVLTIGPNDPLEQAARLMLENKIGCLPVVEDGALVGVITESDIFRAFVQVLGVMEPGTRVQIYAGDLTTALERIAEVARRQGVRIVTVVSESQDHAGVSGVVVRFGTVMIAPLIAALRASGLNVAEPDPRAEGSS